MTLPHRPPTPIDEALLPNLLQVANLAADAAAKFTLAHFRQPLSVDNKASGTEYDPVTIADRQAEAAIRDVLLGAFPDHGFLGEESAPVEQDNSLIWVVDPIDGTRAYITGMPLWGTLIALYDGHDVVLGLLDQPFMQERYVGMPAQTQLHTPAGTQSLSTRSDVCLSQAVLQTTSPDMFVSELERHAFERVRRQVAMARFGGDCYAYALLAMGYIDVIVESSLKPYDIQALIPIIRGAGGVVSDWQGGSAVAGGAVVASGSTALHDEVLACLAGN